MAYSDVAIDVTAKQIEDAVKNVPELKESITEINEKLIDVDRELSDKVGSYDFRNNVEALQAQINEKQNKLIAGNGVVINGNVISASSENLDIAGTQGIEVLDSFDEDGNSIKVVKLTEEAYKKVNEILVGTNGIEIEEIVDENGFIEKRIKLQTNAIDLSGYATKEELEAKADKEEKLAVVKVVTVENEDVSQILIDNIYKYNHLYLYVEIPASDKTGAVSGLMRFQNNLLLVNGYTASAITTSARYYHLRADKNNGEWDVRFGLANTRGQDATVTLKHSLCGFNFTDTKYQGDLWRVEFKSGTSGVYLPVGTRIELRGAE